MSFKFRRNMFNFEAPLVDRFRCLFGPSDGQVHSAHCTRHPPSSAESTNGEPSVNGSLKRPLTSSFKLFKFSGRGFMRKHFEWNATLIDF